MNTSKLLGQVALGYAPLVDRQYTLAATRLSVAPLRPDAPLDVQELLTLVQQVFGERPGVLSVLHEGLLLALAEQPLPRGLQLEWPSFLAREAQHGTALAALRVQGVTLLLKGNSPVTPELRSHFKHAVLDLDELRDASAADVASAVQGLTLLVSGLHNEGDVKSAFELPSVGVVGWSLANAYEAPANAPARSEVQADLQVIVELMALVDNGEDIERMEQVLKRDPSLAFKLLRYLNSAAFGLPVEVSSFRHATMLLGYAKLKRWLALLLTTASKDHHMRPIMYAALRRGLLMEELARSMSDAEQRDEMFICGLFSLLDHMLKQPFAKLLQSIPVPERVRQALVDGEGPYLPYLELARALETGSVFDFRDRAQALMLGAEEINLALIQALQKAQQLE